MKTLHLFVCIACFVPFLFSGNVSAAESPLAVQGVTVTPHLMLDTMHYTQPTEPPDGARVQLFLQYDADAAASLSLDGTTPILVDGQTPATLLEQEKWSWHDTPPASPAEQVTLAPGAMTVWTFNGRKKPYGVGGSVKIAVGAEDAPLLVQELAIEKPECWLSAVTFFAPENVLQPDMMMVHVANESDDALEIRSCRLWLPPDPKMPRVLMPQPVMNTLDCFNGNKTIPAGDKGGFSVKTGPLPLTYTIVEVTLGKGDKDIKVWAHLRIKPEHFDISAGWTNPTKGEPLLKTLKRLHVNTAHMQITPGYTDTELYDKYPLKYFNKLQPFETYDTDEVLPRIHAAEFLGEPQFGGGTPVPPQKVWEDLYPYTVTRLATTVTHSEERIWRDYAGLSDYPHYDAYRVTAPSPDAWWKYERWGKKIFWGSPLETIGDMCRSLRELNRPAPCAIWSQGPHEGWDRYGGRKRTSPTPDEIRLQAYHALSTRITSLYWFNLSLKTLVKWRDTLDELGRIGREMRMLDEFILEGDAYQFERLLKKDGKPDWDIASVCGPHAALLFALDTDYTADFDEKVFKFGDARNAKWQFKLPAYLHGVKDVFRLDADGVYDVAWTLKNGIVEISEKTSRVAIYVATPDESLRSRMEEERQQLIAQENVWKFDPARNDDDFKQLEALLEK